MHQGVSPETRPGALAHAAPVSVACTARDHGNVSLVVGGGDPAAARSALGPLVGVAPRDTVFMEQVHGPDVAIVTRGDAGRGLTDHAGAVTGVDALVTSEPDLALAVLTADCVPLLLFATDAVAVVHAGRAGLLAGVVENAMRAMTRVGAREVTALIGPAIGGCCYEVPGELADQVWTAVPETAARTRWDSPALDLPAGVAGALRRSGVSRTGLVGGCTRCVPERWFSHRAVSDGRQPAAPPGRQASVIALRPDATRPPRLPSDLKWLT